MALRYETIAGEEKSIRSHTGLSKAEFEQLSAAFAREWGHYIGHYTWCGKERRRQSKRRVNSVLATVEDKLLFVLYYLKANPLQEVLASTFGLGKPLAGAAAGQAAGHPCPGAGAARAAGSAPVAGSGR